MNIVNKAKYSLPEVLALAIYTLKINMDSGCAHDSVYTLGVCIHWCNNVSASGICNYMDGTEIGRCENSHHVDPHGDTAALSLQFGLVLKAGDNWPNTEDITYSLTCLLTNTQLNPIVSAAVSGECQMAF